MRLRTAIPLLCVLTLAGCEEKSSAPNTGAPSQPKSATSPPAALPSAGQGTISQGGKTFRPTHSVIVWDEARQELRFHLYPFAPTSSEIEQVRRGQSAIQFGHASPDPRQWAEHCPAASYVLSWARKPKEAVGDLAQARYLIHLHGITKHNANTSVNKLAVEGELSGEIAAGATVGLRVQGRDGPDESPIAWDLNLTGPILTPPPPPAAPTLSAEQKGALGVVTQGERVFKVEGALVKRAPGEAKASVALLPRAPTEADVAAYREGKLRLGEKGSPGYVELYLFCGSEGFGTPPKTTQRKLILKGIDGSLASVSFFMSEGEFSLGGGLEVGEQLTLTAKGLTVSEFRDSAGQVVSWELDLKALEVLAPTPP